MGIDYKSLPVYEQKERILEVLKENQVIVVQSPTGSGKTTQLPVILHEAGYDADGMIAVTQPRRIAALSVSEFIAKQLGTTYPGLVGYKMRFEDKTDASTKIKIMTDGILLQEMKLDPWLSKYSVIMVDEAHERSLNIDFVLGLLKRVLEQRKEFKVIVSSATMNAEAFSKYFNNCPIVTIETQTFPVTMVYDPPAIAASTINEIASQALLNKIVSTVDRVLDNGEEGGILIFLPGEKIIKDCMQMLDHSRFAYKLHTLPLYGRLSKEDQERVFLPAPEGKKKVIISTNIAETSVTISDITTVIDSGLAKLNFYNPHTFTSSLIETQVSKASCNQRRGRAGRTQPGTCYRLYPRKDFDTRPMYTTEEIYRTDLSEVVLQMADLGITDFTGFDFISPPGVEGIWGAVDTLNMLGALEKDHTLSSIGKMMVNFPLEPRISRIIVESIMRYPDVLEEVLIAASFLSANSPFVLPPGEEMEARRAHHAFRDMQGDFVSYLNLFKAWIKCTDNEQKEIFCKKNYLDERIMREIENINLQLKDIVFHLQIPVVSGGDKSQYLACICAGMIQFVCVRKKKEQYQSLTCDNIFIHPGSVMFKQDPLYIVAGEIVRTSRMYAMSVSPLTKGILAMVQNDLQEKLENTRGKKSLEIQADEYDLHISKKKREKEGKKDETRKDENTLSFGGISFPIKMVKGKKQVQLPFTDFVKASLEETDKEKIRTMGGIKCKVIFKNNFTLLEDEKLSTAIKLCRLTNLTPVSENEWNRKLNVNIEEENGPEQIANAIENLMKVAVAKQKSREYGFICLFTDGNGTFWNKVSRGYSTAVNESLASLETLSELEDRFTDEQKQKINKVYGMLNELMK